MLQSWTHRAWCCLRDVPECHGWWSPSDRRMEVSVGAIQLPAGVQENEAQHGIVCPTESALPQPQSDSIPYFSLYICRVCFCSLFYNAVSLLSDNNLGELEQNGWPMLAGHRNGCLLGFWLWLSRREWGSGSGWHGAAPRKQTRASG